MDIDNYWIPRTLDAPRLFFLWEVDIAAVFLFFVFISPMFGLLGGSALFICGFFLTRAFARLKDSGGKGLVRRIGYWHTPLGWRSFRAKSFAREISGA